MDKKLIYDEALLHITIQRLCHEIVENHQQFENTVLLGIQPRGIFLAERIHAQVQNIIHKSIHLGYLDITFYRDDFRRRDEPLKANNTKVDFIIENKNVILIDDVLYTGRTINAALTAMQAFGRPKKIELLTLIDRKYSRDIPIQADYIGREVDSVQSQKVWVAWKEQGAEKDQIWLVYQ